MKAYEIKYQLAKKGLTLSAIANQLGVKRQTVSLIANGRFSSRRISQAIADAMEMPLEEVFPKYRRDKEAA